MNVETLTTFLNQANQATYANKFGYAVDKLIDPLGSVLKHEKHTGKVKV